MILPDSPDAFTNRIALVRERIARAAARAGREPHDVKLVAVSKTFPAADVRRALAAGLADFGENRIQEATGKMGELTGEPIRWHLIGHLQTNKVNLAAGRFALIHSVDSPRLIEALEKRAAALEVRQSILLQINVSGEAVKFGAPPDSLPELVDAVRRAPHLDCRGLMTIPPYDENPEASRPHFARLRELLAQVPREANLRPDELSMGMSGDFETAVEEGATLVRVGSAIFGERA